MSSQEYEQIRQELPHLKLPMFVTLRICDKAAVLGVNRETLVAKRTAKLLVRLVGEVRIEDNVAFKYEKKLTARHLGRKNASR